MISLVCWIDSAQSGGWHDPADAHFPTESLRCYTIGRVVHRDECQIVLAQSWGETPESEIGGLWCIPVTQVRWIRTIEGLEDEVQGSGTVGEPVG